MHVIIVNYRSSLLLSRCVKSLLAESVDSISVWDNSCDEDERLALNAIAKEFGLTVRYSAENIGFGPAANRLLGALDCSDDAPVWLLNPDTEVLPGCVDRLKKAVASTGFGFISPAIIRQADDEIWFAGGAIHVGRGSTVHWSTYPSADSFSCTFLTGAAMAATRSSWERVGGFREDLFLYYEDAALCLDARAMGASLTVVMDAVVMHAVGGSSANPADSRGFGKSPLWYYFLSRNRLLVCQRTAARRLLTAFVIGLLPTLRMLVMAARDRSGPWIRVRAALVGTYHGLIGRATPARQLAWLEIDVAQHASRPAEESR